MKSKETSFQVLSCARLVHQGLIQWSNLHVTLATWEDLEHLKQQFPRTSLWNDPGTQGEGVLPLLQAYRTQRPPLLAV